MMVYFTVFKFNFLESILFPFFWVSFFFFFFSFSLFFFCYFPISLILYTDVCKPNQFQLALPIYYPRLQIWFPLGFHFSVMGWLSLIQLSSPPKKLLFKLAGGSLKKFSCFTRINFKKEKKITKKKI